MVFNPSLFRPREPKDKKERKEINNAETKRQLKIKETKRKKPAVTLPSVKTFE